MGKFYITIKGVLSLWYSFKGQTWNPAADSHGGIFLLRAVGASLSIENSVQVAKDSSATT